MHIRHLIDTFRARPLRRTGVMQRRSIAVGGSKDVVVRRPSGWVRRLSIPEGRRVGAGRKNRGGPESLIFQNIVLRCFPVPILNFRIGAVVKEELDEPFATHLAARVNAVSPSSS